MSDPTPIYALLILVLIPAGICLSVLFLPLVLLPRSRAGPISLLGVVMLLMWAVWLWDFLSQPLIKGGPH
ncbi:MAG: hypothetical protein RIS70_4314 [Planctomycetota bacterium]